MKAFKVTIVSENEVFTQKIYAPNGATAFKKAVEKNPLPLHKLRVSCLQISN